MSYITLLREKTTEEAEEFDIIQNNGYVKNLDAKIEGFLPLYNNFEYQILYVVKAKIVEYINFVKKDNDHTKYFVYLENKQGVVKKFYTQDVDEFFQLMDVIDDCEEDQDDIGVEFIVAYVKNKKESTKIVGYF